MDTTKSQQPTPSKMYHRQCFYKLFLKHRLKSLLSRHRTLLLSLLTLSSLLFLYISGFNETLFELTYEPSLFSSASLRETVEREKFFYRSRRSLPMSRLNNFTYTYTHSPTYKCPSSSTPPSALPTFLMIIRTAPCNTEARSAIRATWGNESQPVDAKLARAFMVGHCAPTSQCTTTSGGKTTFRSCESVLARELSLYGDIIQGSFLDTYKNSTEKTFAAFYWVLQYCLGVQYTFFVDDDFYVFIPNLLAYLNVNSTLHSPYLYMGHVRDWARPQRQLFSSHYVSLSEYAYSKYPPFATGGCFLLNSRTLLDLYFGALHLPKFTFDDVYLGMIASSLNITLQHSEEIYIARQWQFERDGNQTVIASHWFKDPEEMRKVWRALGYA